MAENTPTRDQTSQIEIEKYLAASLIPISLRHWGHARLILLSEMAHQTRSFSTSAFDADGILIGLYADAFANALGRLWVDLADLNAQLGAYVWLKQRQDAVSLQCRTPYMSFE